jgi:hypothetical protein
MGSAGIGNQLPLSLVGSLRAAGPGGLAAVGPAGLLLDQPLSAFGTTSNHRHPPLGASRLSALSSTTVR